MMRNDSPVSKVSSKSMTIQKMNLTNLVRVRRDRPKCRFCFPLLPQISLLAPHLGVRPHRLPPPSYHDTLGQNGLAQIDQIRVAKNGLARNGFQHPIVNNLNPETTHKKFLKSFFEITVLASPGPLLLLVSPFLFFFYFPLLLCFVFFCFFMFFDFSFVFFFPFFSFSGAQNMIFFGLY